MAFLFKKAPIFFTRFFHNSKSFHHSRASKLISLSFLTYLTSQISQKLHSFETEWTFGDEKGTFDQDVVQPSPKTSVMTQLSDESNYKIFSGKANTDLAQEIATHLDVALGRLIYYPSPSGEINLRILDNVRNQHVFVVQSLDPPPNDNITELFLLISSLKRASAKRVTCVIPYFAYMRHTEYSGYSSRKSISIADIARLLESLGCDDIITINLHIPETKGFFRVPVLNLDVTELGANYLSKKKLVDACVVSLDGKRSYVSRATDMKSYLEDKHNIHTGFTCLIKDEVKSDEQKKVYSHIGSEMKGKDCILVDNIIEGGVTLSSSTEYLRSQGANRIFLFVPHGILTHDCLKTIDRIAVDEVITTNTIKEHGKYSDKVRYLSVGKMLAEAISHVKENKTLEEARNRDKN